MISSPYFRRSLQEDAVHDFFAFPAVFPSERAREGLRRAVVAWVDTLPDA